MVVFNVSTPSATGYCNQRLYHSATFLMNVLFEKEALHRTRPLKGRSNSDIVGICRELLLEGGVQKMMLVYWRIYRAS